ncbi:dihydrofolate reductase family protein [Siphonobacter sp. SORGH_AS_1065]|uniref:dihydrofolate reductase family protein n=1 Tax=Siphonobacter sp. SORGH_AS_1065 TaxID=3041795 RepID=UPI0027821E87|nr:dihydrofolate reductase family protein [Siphonobacter sp. SORGH_AS_1065]MDQ1089076.1 dihydrofolate reductase [Siphonobacter sp. SORGH_AS_1065]
MRKLILQEWISLDGFAADENGQTDFFNKPEYNEESEDDVLDFMGTIDAILLGSRTYRMFVEYWPTVTTEVETIADKLNETPKIVFSRMVDHVPWGKWNDARIVNRNAVEEVTRLKNKPGLDMVLWGSLSLAQSLLRAELIDEIQLRVCPVILGKGKRLFSEEMKHLELELLETQSFKSGLVFLKYQPIYTS